MSNIKYQYVDSFRGDDLFIPVVVDIPTGGEIRIHLRQNSEATEYIILSIQNNQIHIPASITQNLLGHFEYDIELTIDGETTTIQHTDIDFIPDVTRIYGDVKQIEISDFEREKIVAKEFYTRNENGELIPYNSKSLKRIQVSGIQDFSNRNFEIDTLLIEGNEPMLYLNGLYVYNDNNYIISGTTLTLTSEMYALGPNDVLTLLF